MAEDRHFWVLDRRVLEYVRFNEFQWWELWAIAGVLAALFGYAMLALFLDRRARAGVRRQKQLARLERWLDDWELEPHQEQALEELVGSPRRIDLYALLADPGRFERAVHAAGGDESLRFLDTIREKLGYRSGNLSVPVVSTRQLEVDDHFRFTVWEEGRPQHHYGIVAAVSGAGVTVELTEAGYQAVALQRGGEVELFYLRGSDVEVRFPLKIRTREDARHRILLAHALVQGGHRARSTRLPMLRPITIRLHAPAGGEDAPPGPAVAPVSAAATEGAEDGAKSAAPAKVPGQRAALLEMSEGGFSMVLLKPVAEGAYVEFDLALPRGRSLKIIGRVLDSRSMSGNRWLTRCEMRGLTSTQRNTLGQALRLEQQRRLRAMQDERRKRRRDEAAGA